MLLSSQDRRRRQRGATLVESSLVSVITLLLLLGTISAGLGVFRFQQLNWLAREGAQWAAVHGEKYRKDNNNAAAPTSQDVLDKVVNPKLVGMTKGSVTCTLTMTDNKAAVTLKYTWVPESFLSAIELQGKAVMPIQY
jgi:Flp pilus assembly protein TadG